MAAYAAAKAGERGLTLPYLVADMTSFAHPDSFDLVASMLCSATYLLTDDAFVAHLDGDSRGARGRRALRDGAAPPLRSKQDEVDLDRARRLRRSSTWRWLDGEQGGTPGCSAPGFASNTAGSTAARRYSSRTRRCSGSTRSPTSRRWVARRGAVRGIDGLFGALDEAVPLDGEAAWRMLVVLKKRNPRSR